MPIKEIQNIEISPDSGHQVFFIPLMPADTSAEEAAHAAFPGLKERKEDLTEPEKTLIREQGDKNMDWRQWKDYSWILYRIDRLKKRLPDKQIEIYGVWLALETNLGDETRGCRTLVYDKVLDQCAPKCEEYMQQRAKKKEGKLHIYAFEGKHEIDEKKPSFKIDIVLEAGSSSPVCSVQIKWIQDNAIEPIPVDLLIDFGNTRTTVLALNRVVGDDAPDFSAVCKPISFYPRNERFDGFKGFNFDELVTTIDSFFVLHEPRFKSNRLKSESGYVLDGTIGVRDARSRAEKLIPFYKKDEEYVANLSEKLPHRFCEFSPTMLGEDAWAANIEIDLEKCARLSMSSPKRYYWDNDLGCDNQSFWNMISNPWNRKAQDGSVIRLAKLEGDVLRFFPVDEIPEDRDWDIDNPPTTWEVNKRPIAQPGAPLYARCDALTWVALAILETAHTQINSEGWRRGNQPFIRRKLDKINVLFPSGWTNDEIQLYRKKWQNAIDIFALTRLTAPKAQRPKLVMTLDEAVASQLPFVYGEMCRAGNHGENWLESVGRKDKKPFVRLMSIDIGGGTTDISVVEYEDTVPGHGIRLSPQVLFKDSSSLAGDYLRKKIIENVLLPKLGNKFSGNALQNYKLFWKASSAAEADKAIRARQAKVVLLPIVNRWLSNLVTKNEKEFTFIDVVKTDSDMPVLSHLNEAFNKEFNVNLISQEEKFATPVLELNRCIRECFGGLLEGLAKHVAAFGCDMVLVMGKPSELPLIKEMLDEYLPICRSRIVSLMGYEPGTNAWPLSRDGIIHDAKQATVVGAAFYQAIANDMIRDWKILPKPSAFTQNNYWGVINKDAVPLDFDREKAVMKPGENQCVITVMASERGGSFIGRRLIEGRSQPEPVYQVRVKRGMKLKGVNPQIKDLQITINRISVPGINGEETEKLDLTAAQGQYEYQDEKGQTVTEPINTDLIELHPRNMMEDSYWLDSGKFEVRFGQQESSGDGSASTEDGM